MFRTEFDLGWAIGLFEGEGCFSVQAFENRTRCYPIAVIENADEDVMRRFAFIVEVGTLRQRKTTRGNKKLWRWAASSRSDFSTFANLVRPHLSNRRLSRLIEVENEATPIKRDIGQVYSRPASVIERRNT